MSFDSDDPIVFAAWQQAVGSGHNEHYRELLARYGEPHRRYHTVAHLRHFLDVANQLVPERWRDAEFLFAALMHDIVYDTSRNDNEERSAELARQWMDSDAVVQLILATKQHNPLPGRLHQPSMYFLDCDMAILGTPQEVYDQYARAIREEYSNYDDAMYKAGRKQFLQRTLDRQRIFLTEEFCAAFEQSARENLQFEVQLLR
jgi:predicted metal-dependent HD superfamily phosphohydrolase